MAFAVRFGNKLYPGLAGEKERRRREQFGSSLFLICYKVCTGWQAGALFLIGVFFLAFLRPGENFAV
jgi:hypothetical protein